MAGAIWLGIVAIAVIRLLMALHRNREFDRRPPREPTDPVVLHYMRQQGHWGPPPPLDHLSEKEGHGDDQ